MCSNFTPDSFSILDTFALLGSYSMTATPVLPRKQHCPQHPASCRNNETMENAGFKLTNYQLSPCVQICEYRLQHHVEARTLKKKCQLSARPHLEKQQIKTYHIQHTWIINWTSLMSNPRAATLVATNVINLPDLKSAMVTCTQEAKFKQGKARHLSIKRQKKFQPF